MTTRPCFQKLIAAARDAVFAYRLLRREKDPAFDEKPVHGEAHNFVAVDISSRNLK
jgi:hypothetical protein